eukprot:scaffold7595_cov74-Skeletonema_dohrnii-CCMP3373.AAC.1
MVVLHSTLDRCRHYSILGRSLPLAYWICGGHESRMQAARSLPRRRAPIVRCNFLLVTTTARSGPDDVLAIIERSVAPWSVSWSVSWSVPLSVECLGVCLRAISELSQSCRRVSWSVSQSYLRAISELSQSVSELSQSCGFGDRSVQENLTSLLLTLIYLHDGLGRHSKKREVWPASIHQYVVDCPVIFI